MKYLYVFLVLLIFLSCSNKPDAEKERQQLILNGIWHLVDYEKSFKNIEYGLKFSEDKQIFYIDSQGHTVPPHIKHVYKIKGDTLKIIDYKFEPQAIFEKGTMIFLINELTENKLVLDVLHPNAPNKLIFENRN